MVSSALPSRHRGEIALACCLLMGLGAGTGCLGYLLWHAGYAAEGVGAAAAQRWTISSAIVAVAAAVTGSAALTAELPSRRAIGNKITWAVAAILLASAAVAFTRPAPVTGDGEPVSNASLFIRLAPVALLVAGLMVAVAAALARWILADERPSPPSWWRSWSVGILAAGLLVGTGLLLPRLVDSRIDAANTEYVRASAPAGTLPSELNGDIAWSADVAGESGQRIRSTVGGLAVRRESPGGVEMLDPRTGEVRWSWHRTDLDTGVEPMVVSADGTLIAARFTRRDQHPEPPSVVVLDAETGAVRAELTGVVGSPLAVTADQVVTVQRNKVDLAAYGFDGQQRWAHEMSSPIKNDEELFFSATEDTLLLTVDTDSPGWRSAAVDTATGEIRWQEKLPPGMRPLQIVPGSDLAVTGGLDRLAYQGSVASLTEPVKARVIAFGLSDGEPVWERTLEVPQGVEGDIDRDGCSPYLDVAAGHLTFLGCADYGRATRLTALAPETGALLWEQTVTAAEGYEAPRLYADDPLQAMPDGSTALLTTSQRDCVILRSGAEGVREVPIREGVRGACAYTSWYAVGETALLHRVADRALIALH